MKQICCWAAALCCAAFVTAPVARAGSTYIGLGDSITFGETDLSYTPSLGDRGYVSQYADFLGKQSGTRPDVINLAIDGETADSFMTGVGRTPPVVGRTDAILAAQNLNYDSGDLSTQRELFFEKAEEAAAAGNPVKHVSISLGFNELAALASDPSTAMSKLPDTLAKFRTSYDQVLTEIRQQLFGADVTVLGYFNPFPADPTSPAAPIFNEGGSQLNAIIEELADAHDANYVDTSLSFIGNEAKYTYLDEMPHGSSVGDPFGGVLPIGNIHPNEAGYAAIAADISGTGGATAIPLPPGVLGGALMLTAVAGVRARQVFATRARAA